MQKAIVIINDEKEVINAYNLDKDYVYELYNRGGIWLIAKGKEVK